MAVGGLPLFEHAKAAGHLYQAHLRHELVERLGVRFRPTVNGYAEIDGVPDAVIEVFSKRRNEIEEELAATGRTTARSAQVATLETRKARTTASMPTLWRTSGVRKQRRRGSTSEQLAACTNVPGRRPASGRRRCRTA